MEYLAAHAFGVLEFVVEARYAPHWKHVHALQLAGLVLVVAGQGFRSLAMVHASTNFSHAVAHTKRAEHVLVQDGIYAYVAALTSYARHPSYAGFFFWALGTQLLLGNPVATLAFAWALQSFFSQRIRGRSHTHPVEETLLHRFFGSAYADYCRRVPAGVPFVRASRDTRRVGL